MSSRLVRKASCISFGGPRPVTLIQKGGIGFAAYVLMIASDFVGYRLDSISNLGGKLKVEVHEKQQCRGGAARVWGNKAHDVIAGSVFPSPSAWLSHWHSVGVNQEGQRLEECEIWGVLFLSNQVTELLM